MKILVTGGAGFIGSAFIRHILASTNDFVINLDKLTYAGNTESIPNELCSERYAFEAIDICDRASLMRIFEQYQPDGVMHLAAESHVDRSINDPSEFMRTNIMGTFTLLEATRAYWSNLATSRKQRFIFHHISTDEVYGDLPHPNELAVGAKLPLFTEKTAYAPSSPYSASKASSDHLVRAWHRTYGLPIVITNSSNIFGPYQFPEKLIPHMILNALKGNPLPIYGDGSQIRDWLYVEDHVRALYAVLKFGKVSQTYNIGGHNEKSNLEVVATICDLLQQLAPIKPNGVQNFRDLITFVENRPGHDTRYAIDATKIHNELDWAPQETFDSGIRKTIMWYLNNHKWWQRVLSGAYRLERLGVTI